MFPPARWLFPSAVPRSLARPGSSSQEIGLPYRVRAACHLPVALELRASSLGSCLPFATEAYEVHLPPGFPHPTTFRPQCFSHSRRLAPSHTAWAYFIPLPRPGFTPQGVSPLPSRLTSSESRALMSLARFSSRRVAPPVPDPPAPSSGLWSEQRSVATDRGVSPAHRSIPSRVFTPAGFSPSTLEAPSHPLRS
jgi:hypothetical protein